ncbi:hypothetical protein SCUP234_09940 [Seiridium cupressi]
MSQPTENQPHPLGLAQRKRQACERCRTQKLRCIRDDKNPANSCYRCADYRVKCITNPPKKAGRPARCQKKDQQLPTVGIDNEAGAHLNTEGVQGLFDDGASWALNDISMDPFALYDYEAAQMNANSMPSSEKTQAGDGEYFYQQTGDLAGVPSSQNETITRPDTVLSTVLQFLHLQQDLTELIIKLKSTPWDITATLKMDVHAEVHDSLAEAAVEHTSFNPVASTFELIYRFDRLLESLGHHTSSSDLSAAADIFAPVNAQVLLNALACYIHVLSVYDCIISYILDEASTSPTVKNFILHTYPKLSIAGFEIQPSRNFFGRLFVRLLESRIAPIEVALSIPDAVRISSGKLEEEKIRATGLFCGKEMKPLLDLLDISVHEGSSSGTDAKWLEALRKKMNYLQSCGHD